MGEFYARHPIATWVFGIGAALVVIWALFGRAFGGSTAQSDGAQYVTATPGPSPDAMLAASVQLQSQQIAAAADARRGENELTYGLAQLGVQRQHDMQALANDDRFAEMQYNLNVYSIASGEKISLAELNAQTQQFSMVQALERYRIEADLQRDLDTNATYANVQNTASNNARRTSRSNGILGVLGGILGGIFSDARLKTNVECIGPDANGVMWYNFNYAPLAYMLDPTLPKGRVRGVLAQNMAVHPVYKNYVGEANGYLTFNYAMSGLNGLTAA